MLKRVFILLLSAVFFVGCVGSDNELARLNSMEALGTESVVSNRYELSYRDEQEMVYAQVSNRRLLDLGLLEKVSENDVQAVRTYMDRVDGQLRGEYKVRHYSSLLDKTASEGLVKDDSVMDVMLSDYLLTYMSLTPYDWQRSKTLIRGVDGRSRAIVVDVEYKTTGYEKDVIGDSKIVRGMPDYDKQMNIRLQKWLNILNLRRNGGTNLNLPRLESAFLKYYGDPEEIIAEQRDVSLSEKIHETGVQGTYSGLVDTDIERGKATMVVRYILVPQYVMGINLGLSCRHMYMVSYALDEDPTEGSEQVSGDGLDGITSNLYDLIYRYFTALDESNFKGLYKLTSNFGGLDKHYENMFTSAYQKHEGFSVSLFKLQGVHMTLGVSVSVKERARNSNMSLPVYLDRYLVDVELVGDALRVSNMVLLSRRLEGEPAIEGGTADTEGFSAIITIGPEAKQEIERLISDFSAFQLKNDVNLEEFSEYVDMGISSNRLNAIKKVLSEYGSNETKVVFLDTYQQGTADYASVGVREFYKSESNEIIEARGLYEFIRRGGRWYIYNYDINTSIRLDTTNLLTSGALCVVSAGSVDYFRSQVLGSGSKDDTGDDKAAEGSVVTLEHSYKAPRRKSGKEQGLVKFVVGDITSDVWVDFSNRLGFDYTSFDAVMQGIGGQYRDKFDEAFLMIYNTVSGRYSDEEKFTNKGYWTEFSQYVEALGDELNSVFVDIPVEDRQMVMRVFSLLSDAGKRL